jgi:hypothetical protein
MQRLIGLLIALLLAACSSPPPPHDYAALRYGYLTKLRLNVGSISIDDSWTPRGGVRDVSSLSPVQPIDALRQMAEDRLVAGGTGGRAVFRIADASIIQVGGDRFDGHLDVVLDIYTADNVRTAYAEAQVAHSISGTGTGPEEVRQTLYTLTKEMMDDMNVEFEYQLKHALHDWLQDDTPSSGVVPAPVQAQPLAAPVD